MTTPPDPSNPGSSDPTPGPGDLPGQVPNPGGAYPPPGSYPPPGAYPPPPQATPGGYPPPQGPPGGYQPPQGTPGGYPPPQGPPGAYPPPPSGYDQPAYGSAAPYGQPAFGGPVGEFSVGDAITYGWNRFKENAAAWILVILAGVIVIGVIEFLAQLLSQNVSVWLGVLIGIVAALGLWVFQAAFVRGALDEVSGTKPQFGSFFAFNNYGAIFGTAFLVAIGSSLGTIFSGISVFLGFALSIVSAVFSFFAFWSMTFVVDRQVDPITGIKASFSTISKNIGQVFLLALVNALLLIVGALLCGVGLLVAGPIVAISSTYAYRFFTGGQIAPLASAVPGGYPPPGQYPQ